jgi:hypothetical protein
VPIETADTVAATARELRLCQPEWEAIGPKGRKTWLLIYALWWPAGCLLPDRTNDRNTPGGAGLLPHCLI